MSRWLTTVRWLGRVLENSKIDVILDYRMPKLDGLQFLSAPAKIAGCGAIKVIVLDSVPTSRSA